MIEKTFSYQFTFVVTPKQQKLLSFQTKQKKGHNITTTTKEH